jgi:hypothetical protein
MLTVKQPHKMIVYQQLKARKGHQMLFADSLRDNGFNLAQTFLDIHKHGEVNSNICFQLTDYMKQNNTQRLPTIPK